MLFVVISLVHRLCNKQTNLANILPKDLALGPKQGRVGQPSTTV